MKMLNAVMAPRCRESSLLQQNRNFCSSVTLPQRHSSVFHAGIIGNGIRQAANPPPPPSTTGKTATASGLTAEEVC